MNNSLKIAEHFDDFCAGGEEAAEFRVACIDGPFDAGEIISLDFLGVRNMNSSFCNALIANLAARDGEKGVRRLRFLNCNATIQVHIRAAIGIGLARYQATHLESHST